MKAIVCQSFDAPLELKEMPVPTPASDEVLIRVVYAGVNFPDTLIITGKYQFKPDFPFSPGQEVSGVVEAVGADVKKIKKGDRVAASFTWGGFAEMALAKQQNVYLLPAEVDLRSAACLIETYATALHALKDRALLSAGEWLLILGAAGGTGLAAAQLGALFGAKVVAVVSTEEKRKFLIAQGVEEVLVSGENLKDQLKAFGGVDVIFDPVGGQLSETAFRAINPEGRHLVVGFASGQIPAIPFNLPLLKSASIVGVFWGSFWRQQPAANRRNVQLLLKWLAAEKIEVAITQEYALSQANEALQDLMDRKAKGKIVLKVGE